MSKSDDVFYSYETCPQLTNPMLLVLPNHDVEQRLMQTDKFFDVLGCRPMRARLSTGVPCLSEDDGVIIISSRPSRAGSYLSLEAFDRVIRQNKLHKYPHNNDLTVCLFFDSFSSNIPLSEICTELYNTLTNAYYNRVVFDIYFLLLEDFVASSKRRFQNLIAAQKLGDIQSCEWVRYIFLLSDVNSEGQLTNDYNGLFTTVLMSIFLTNSCNGDGKSLGRLEDVLMRETETGKFFCLGHISLQQSSQDIRHMVRTELLRALSKNAEIKTVRSEEISIHSMLASDVKNEVDRQSFGIMHIPCYRISLPDNINEINKSNFLDICFHDGPARFIDEAENRCRKHFTEHIGNYWRQLKTQMDDMLCQFDHGLSDEGCEEYVASKVDMALSKYEQLCQDKRSAINEEILLWKSQALRVCSRKVISIAFNLLEEWRDLRVREIVIKLLNFCISDMRTRINYWRDDIARKCRQFSMLCQREESSWNTLVRDSDMASRILLEYRQRELTSYLHNNQWWIDACRGRINFLLREQIGETDLVNIVAAETEQLLCEGLQASLPWSDTNLPEDSDPRIDELYTGLYQALKNEIPLLTRRRIYNAPTYLCFFGGASARFIEYVCDQGEYQYLLHFDDKSSSPVVLFFRHIESSAVFFWKELNSEGGKK